MRSGQLTAGTGRLAKFALRKDRIRLPVWLASITLSTWGIVLIFAEMYAEEAERQAVAATMLNPAVVAMIGPGYGLDNYTLGALTAQQLLLFTAIAVAIMSILLTAGHTCGEEEEGQLEMIRSLPVGRLANPISAAAVLTAASAVLTAVIGIGLRLFGIESMDLEGSLLYGAALGVTGLFFTAITILFAQLSDSVRGTVGLSFAFLIVTYLMRAAGDIGNEVLSYLSPLGLILRAEVYVSDYWWPIGLTAAAAALLFAAALLLNSRRDLGSGLLPQRAGRMHAGVLLRGPFGLAVRIQRTALIAWSAGLFVLGASYGSVLGDLEAYFANNAALLDMLPPGSGFTLAEQFVSLLMVVMAMISTIPVLITFLKLKGEEKKGRTSHVLTRSVPRGRLLLGYLLLSLLVSLGVQLLTVTGLWAVGNAVLEGAFSFTILFKASVIYLPAMWVMLGLAVLLLGWLPRRTGLAYFYLAYSFFVVYLGGMLQLPDWLAGLSPFDYVPRLPVEEYEAGSMTLLTFAALALTVTGMYGYRRRDIAD
ncbi:ABC transporter permease [Indiicoccus explosivorum]|uniref:ABC transporter permease n=1 Tax=Indiicoccus explosivorum TaxID=1917864 RepID=UPI000B44B3DD|nr:ABC transporter permease [Indiicoccus explosivorum]